MPNEREHRQRPSARVRVLMVSPRYLPLVGGVELHVDQVARRLAKRGTEVTVLTTDTTGALSPSERVDGFAVTRVRAWPSGRDYYFAPHLYREIVQSGCDLVHVQSFQTFVAPLAMYASLRSNLPYVVTFHTGGHSSFLRKKLRPFQFAAVRPMLARANRLIALTSFEIDEWTQRLRLPRERFALIPNGSDLAPADTLRSITRSVRREPALIASIGRLERYKGHHRVLAALPYVLRRRPDAFLWIAGSGPYEGSLRQLARELGVSKHVEIRSIAPEDREGMARQLARVKVAVSLSEFETQPMAALEALSVGCRLLVADTPGLRPLGDDGLARLVSLDRPPDDVAAMIVEELEKPPVEHQLALPTWDDCADGLIELYRSVIQSQHFRAAARRP
jgi:glycogen synthase